MYHIMPINKKLFFLAKFRNFENTVTQMESVKPLSFLSKCVEEKLKINLLPNTKIIQTYREIK